MILAKLKVVWDFLKKVPGMVWYAIAFVGVWLYARSIKRALDAERSAREAEQAKFERNLREQEEADRIKKEAAAARKAAREKAAEEKRRADEEAARKAAAHAADQALLDDAVERDAVEDEINRRINSGDLAERLDDNHGDKS